MNNPLGRFEFRIWGNHLSPFRDRLAAIAAAAEPLESAETYILSRATDTANVKIRAELIDIKLMTEQVGRLERWRPVLKSAFPLDSRTIVEQLFPHLGVPVGQITQPSYTSRRVDPRPGAPASRPRDRRGRKSAPPVYIRKVHRGICRSSNRRRRHLRNSRDRIGRSRRRPSSDRKAWPELSREYKLRSSPEADDWNDAARKRLGQLSAR